MDYKQIMEIIERFNASDITHLEIEQADLKLKLEKNHTAVVAHPPSGLSNDRSSNEMSSQETGVKEGTEVRSPLVGTFYAAPSPQDEPYVKVGQRVKKGDTVCIIEAMKIMNEITAPVDGVVDAILVQNGDVVSYDQVLMIIK
ncbi:MAG TPA: acetyl-CoA carboxylase biotin carboxyl carrier protein [Haloplasmataceae bacterium]